MFGSGLGLNFIDNPFDLSPFCYQEKAFWDCKVELYVIKLTDVSHSIGYRADIVSEKSTLQELASTESDCSSARKEGDLGFFGPGQMQSKSLINCNCNKWKIYKYS